MAASGTNLTDTPEGSAEDESDLEEEMAHLLENQERKHAEDEEMSKSERFLDDLRQAGRDGKLSDDTDSDASVEGLIDDLVQ